MNDFNQTIQNQEESHGFFTRKKTIILIVLGVILAIEALWAFNVLSSKKSPGTTTLSLIPELPSKQIAVLSVEPIAVNTLVGEQFTQVISVDLGEREVNGIDAVILFDPNLLQVVDSDVETPGIQTANGDLFPSLLFNDVDNQEGVVTITASRISPETPVLSVNGILAAITFEAINPGETSIEIVSDTSSTSTSNVTEAKTSENILTTVVNATITIAP